MIHITLKDMPGVLDENQIKMSNASWDEDLNYGGVAFSTHQDAQKAKALVEKKVAAERARCAGIAKDVSLCFNYNKDWMGIADLIFEKISDPKYRP